MFSFLFFVIVKKLKINPIKNEINIEINIIILIIKNLWINAINIFLDNLILLKTKVVNVNEQNIVTKFKKYLNKVSWLGIVTPHLTKPK